MDSPGSSCYHNTKSPRSIVSSVNSIVSLHCVLPLPSDLNITYILTWEIAFLAWKSFRNFIEMIVFIYRHDTDDVTCAEDCGWTLQIICILYI